MSVVTKKISYKCNLCGIESDNELAGFVLEHDSGEPCIKNITYCTHPISVDKVNIHVCDECIDYIKHS